MKLGQLFPAAARGSHADKEITGITADSRAVGPGMIFVAVAGTRADGHGYAAEAVRQGAIAIIGEREKPRDLAAGVLYMRVADPRRVLALTASALHARQPKTIVAVTGTAGKTSVAEFTRQIFASLGHQAASLGTIGIVTSRGAAYGSLTTPDPVALHQTLDRLAGAGITHLAMEASSHGLDQRRLDGVRLSAAGFTNLGRDHLDYHPTMHDYLNAKLRLFDTLLRAGQPAVINADDTYSAQVVVSAFSRGLDIFSVGREGMDLRLVQVEPDHFAQTLTLVHQGRTRTVKLPLVGAFQAQNALVAAGLAIVTGSDAEAVIEALATLKGVRGRLDRVGEVHGAPVFVDYAHKPEALANALGALRPFTRGRLVVVFGCGGDRDPGKRPIMGRIASELADRVIVTDDNPRSEDPAAIRAAILAASPGAEEIGDRAEAIRTAVLGLRPEDCLIIAGKGHETGQILGDRTLPFSDHEIAADAIEIAQAIPPIAPGLAPPKQAEGPIETNGEVEPASSGEVTTEQPSPDARPEPNTAIVAAPALWSAEQLAALPEVRILGELRGGIGGVSIDTRTIRVDDLFVAIRGDRHDGHDFVADAFRNGATAAIVSESESERLASLSKEGALLVVPDSLKGLEQLAALARARTSARIAAVTGSVGKTSSKEALRQVLSEQGLTHASVASYNNHWGVPLTLARMPEPTKFGIFEIGMNHAGEITPLTRMVRPHVALITAVEAVHIENFQNVEGIADAKAEIFLGLAPGGVAILPRDNPHFERLRDHAERAGAERILTFGFSPDADARALDVKLEADRSEVEASIGGRRIAFELGAPGRHMVGNSLGVLAVVEALGGDLEQASRALAQFGPAQGRGARLNLRIDGRSILLLDESYNANPASMRAAIEVLGRLKPGKGGRRIAVLGDMLELGPDAARMHQELALALIAASIDRVFASGPLMKHLFDRLPKTMRGAHAETSEQLEPLLREALADQDVVMVKGSNGSRMGRIVTALKTAESMPAPEPTPVG